MRTTGSVTRGPESPYVEQLLCVNLLVSSLVEEISTHDPDAIVILTGDHGTSSRGQWHTLPDQWSEPAVEEVMSVFSAYRLPEACRESLTPDLELVSTFRVVINCLFDTELTLLSGRYYYALPPHMPSPSIFELQSP